MEISTQNDISTNPLSAVDLFSAFRTEELDQLFEQATVRSYAFGETIFRAGDSCSGVYVVLAGTVRLFVDNGGKDISVGLRKTADVFAELGALREHEQEYTARSSASTEVLFVPRLAIASVLKQNHDAASHISRYTAMRTAGNALTHLFELKGKIDQGELEQLVSTIGIKRIPAGTTIVEQNSSDDHRLYVVHQGDVEISYAAKGNEYSLAHLQQGDVFGEHAALSREKQQYSAIAQTDTVLLIVPEQTLDFVLDRNPHVRDILVARTKRVERELERQQKVTATKKNPLILDLSSKPRIGEKVLPRFPLVDQAEEADCGAACLAMICKYYGVGLTLGKLRDMTNVTTEGATLDSLARVGESLGFRTRGIQTTFASLIDVDLPFIAHWEGYHYVVVYGVSKRHVWVADPGRGFAKMTTDEFERGWAGTCLLFSPATDMARVKSRSPWARFASYLKPYKGILSHLVMATIIIETLGVAPPVIVQNILDRVVVHANVELLHILIIGLALVQVFAQLSTVLRGFLANYLTRNLDFSMLSQFFMHTLSLPISFFDKRRTGDIFARFQENETVRGFMTESTISTLLNLLMVFIYFTVLFMYNVKMTLLLIAFVVPMALLTVAVTPILKGYARRAFETSTDAEAVLMETISGAETVKAMAIERPMRLRWERKYADALDVQYRAQRFEILLDLISELLNAAATIAVLLVGANMVLSQELTIGQLIAFNMLMGSALSPLMGLIGLWDEVQETAVAMERLGDVLDIEPEQKAEDIEARIVLPDISGAVAFQNVFFSYNGEDGVPVLKDINLTIDPGEMVAIVGPSGSGKTTLAKLIVGFYGATEGKILVDDYDIDAIDVEHYRRQIGYVMQNNLLFSGSVIENIAAGEDNPDKRRVVDVAKLADAHSFITALPSGYEQTIGERGIGLSGGQMQRLCIARALYRDPRLLVLDEATSALDTQSENNILNNMSEVLHGRTSIVIAHRLSTIMNADKIVVLYDGAITEVGKHQELVDRRGMYYQLIQRQMSEFTT